jgi:hypothetical protein
MPRRPYTAPPPRRRWKPDRAARVTLSAALSSLHPHRRCRPRRHRRLAPRRLRLAPRLEPEYLISATTVTYLPRPLLLCASYLLLLTYFL